MEKIWLKNYPEDVKAEIDINEYNSVYDIFHQSAQKNSEKPCFSNMGTTLNYQQIEYKVDCLAAYLQQVVGLKKGDRIAIMMPNILQNPIAIFAALKAGLTVVNTNPLYSARELKHQLVDSEAKAIIVVENFCATLEKIVNETNVESIITTQLGDLLAFPKSLIVNAVVKYVKKMVPSFSFKNSICFKQALKQGEQQSFEFVTIGHDDIAFLQYTGGTTGVAKGAMLTNRNMIANMQQASEWIRGIIKEGEETIITALPLYHIFSLTANCLTFMKFGALNYLITNPRDMKGFVKELKNVKFSVVTGVNTLFNGLMNTPGFTEIDFSHLKISLGGGMAVQKVVAERWKTLTDSPLLEAYGLTETSPAVCINPLNAKDFNGSIGLPISSTDVCVQNEQGEILPQGEPGELCVKGPQVMKGYWKKEEETNNSIIDGWFHTGDIAKMDEEGYFYIVDRLKDMILVSGFNVFPNEVEAVLSSHEGILEVGVVGEVDENCGEVVKAVIVKKDETLTKEAIRKFCKSELTAYKVPKIIEFTDELPKTNVGKVLRRELRSTNK
ncbi:MAG: AMP-binding protein [Gammaproteobacteria bacterium]|nr:AMP-binding protein [Gammaproteobacteria bacterium]